MSILINIRKETRNANMPRFTFIFTCFSNMHQQLNKLYCTETFVRLIAVKPSYSAVQPSNDNERSIIVNHNGLTGDLPGAIQPSFPRHKASLDWSIRTVQVSSSCICAESPLKISSCGVRKSNGARLKPINEGACLHLPRNILQRKLASA